MGRRRLRRSGVHVTPHFRLKTPKKCACGLVHISLPADAIVAPTSAAPGYYFTCTCGSTLLVPLDGVGASGDHDGPRETA